METSDLSGQRVSKNDELLHFVGTVDELNSHLGLIKVLLSNEDACKFIKEVQKNLMIIMTHASAPENEKYFLCDEKITALEKEIERLSKKINIESQFVLPGKNIKEAQTHIARTVARRAERLFDNRKLCQKAGTYLNRLSDYLFVLSQSM
jgi:cob(I)alamin adenosyltransferase